MTNRELKNRTAADMRLVAKTMHTYANRIEAGEFSAIIEMLARVPTMVRDVADRYMAGSNAQPMEAGR